MREVRRRAAALALGACLLAALPAAGKEPPTFHVGAGVVWPAELSSGLWLTAGAGIPVWRVSIEPEVGYWSRSETAFGIHASLHDLQAGATVTFTLARVAGLRLFLGGGGAAHFVKSTGGPVTGSTETDTDVRPGVQALGGLEGRLGKVSVFAIGRSDWIQAFGSNERETRAYAGLRIPF